jgi:hypothetical protein
MRFMETQEQLMRDEGKAKPKSWRGDWADASRWLVFNLAVGYMAYAGLFLGQTKAWNGFRFAAFIIFINAVTNYMSGDLRHRQKGLGGPVPVWVALLYDCALVGTLALYGHFLYATLMFTAAVIYQMLYNPEMASPSDEDDKTAHVPVQKTGELPSSHFLEGVHPTASRIVGMEPKTSLAFTNGLHGERFVMRSGTLTTAVVRCRIEHTSTARQITLGSSGVFAERLVGIRQTVTNGAWGEPVISAIGIQAGDQKVALELSQCLLVADAVAEAMKKPDFNISLFQGGQHQKGDNA